MTKNNIQYFSELTSAQILSSVQDKTLIWPIGGVEQHGPHLPLNVDSIIPQAFADQLAQDIGGIVLPLQPISMRSLPQSGGGLEFPGTLYVDGATFISYIFRTLKSLSTLPFKRLVIINGHYENESFIFEALDELRVLGHFGNRTLHAFSWWSLVTDTWIQDYLPHFPGWHAEHAGITETSLMLKLRPDLVTDARPDHECPPRAGIYQLPISPKCSTQGVLSKTSTATVELGTLIFEHIRAQILCLLKE